MIIIIIFLIKDYWKKLKKQSKIGKLLGNDSSNYAKEYPVCIIQKEGINIKPITTPIIPKGTRERYIGDDWKLHKDFSTLSDYGL